ncbi:MAG: single-stranded-DNA-specific exonuclease RecJ [Armatimonadota bacterium]|nr:single-stranded-DNA-specific exonuclease RecJ [Armatimonadota bacterium]
MVPSALSATRWILRPPDPEQAASLARALHLSLPAAQLLLHRRLTDPAAAERFLRADLADLSDPAVLLDLPRAAGRILQAVRHGELLTVYGDYDADGVTATAILVRGLRTLGAEVAFFIPRREVEGYGLSAQAVGCLEAPGLLVTVDCGITAVEEVRYAASRGFEVIVLDHHEPGELLPPAWAVVAPTRPGQPPVTPLAACGLAYQVVRAVWEQAGMHRLPEELVDLAAVGTLADVVPLVGDNRILARRGLERLSTAPSVGLGALLREAGLCGRVRPRDVTFALAPRLNAAGRMGDARAAVTLLLTDDPVEAADLARMLDQENRRRQDLTDQVLAEAAAQVEGEGWADAPALVVAGEGWHPGVIGIVASYLVERYSRPAVVIAVQGEVGRGSARSIEALPLVNVLDACAGLLQRYGGHAMAAGLTIAPGQIEAFRGRFLQEAGRRLRPEDLVPAIHIDAELALGDLTLDLARELERLAPFGPGNPEPVFAVRGVRAAATRVVGEGHLRLGLTDGHSFIDAIGFARGDVAEVLAFTGARLDVAGSLQLERWDDQEKVSLVLRDLSAPGLDLDAVLADGRLLVERLFARAPDYLGGELRGVEEAVSFHTKVAGVTFEGRQSVIPHVRPGQRLRLVREPANPHDPHAVAVCTEDGQHLGYLSARLAGRLAPSMDAGTRYQATASQVTGGGERSYGLNIFVQRDDGEATVDRLLWMAWRQLPPAELIDRLRLYLHPGQSLREVQMRLLLAALEEAEVTTTLGPGRRGAATAVLAAAALAVRRGRPAVLALPLATLVDRWYEVYAPLLREAGFRPYRAHGALPLRRRQSTLRALEEGRADILLASEEWLCRGGLPEPPPAVVVVSGAGLPSRVGSSWAGTQVLVRFAWEGSGPGVPAAVDERHVRANLRLVDRRGADLEAVIGRPPEGEKTLVFLPEAAEAVALADRLRQRMGPAVAYYHGRLPVRVRRVLEQLFLDGGISLLVTTAAFPELFAPGDITRVILAGLPRSRGELVEVAALAGLSGRAASTVLAYSQEDVVRARARLDEQFPPRARLADLYRLLRDAPQEALVWPGEALDRLLQPSGWSPVATEAALEILAEVGVIQREEADGRWRLEPVVAARRELSASVWFAEGMRERAALEAMLPWAFGPASAILQTLAAPVARGAPP